MLYDHNQGREYIALMNKTVEAKNLTALNDAAAKYRDLMRSHIEKENNVLFVMADKILDDAKQDELFGKFELY